MPDYSHPVPAFCVALTQIKAGSYWSMTSKLEKSEKEAKSFAWPPLRKQNLTFVMQIGFLA